MDDSTEPAVGEKQLQRLEARLAGIETALWVIASVLGSIALVFTVNSVL